MPSSGYTLVSASRCKDSTGTLIPAGALLTCTPCDNNGNPLAFRDGSSTPGQTSSESVSTTLSAAGTFSITLADGSLATPGNVGYNFVISDAFSGAILLAYKCVQWPTGTTFDFDTYTPNVAAQAVIQTGPAGAPGTVSVFTQEVVITPSMVGVPQVITHNAGMNPAPILPVRWVGNGSEPDSDLIDLNSTQAQFTAYGAGAWSISVVIPGPSTLIDPITSLAGLVEYWKLNEGTGTTFANKKTPANPMTATGVTWPAGFAQWSGATGAGGVASAIESASDLDFTKPGSISFWDTVNPAVGSDDVGISNGRVSVLFPSISATEAQVYFVFDGNVGNLCSGDISNEIFCNSRTLLTKGVLTNFILTWDGTNTTAGIHFYVNGLEWTYANGNMNGFSGASSITIATVPDSPWHAGNFPSTYGASYPSHGSQRQIAIFNQVLTADQRALIYATGGA